MAYKKPKATFDVTGKTIQELSNLGYEKYSTLPERDKARINSRLISAVNKRIARMQNAGVVSPAMQKMGTDYRFSVKFNNIKSFERAGKLMNQYKIITTFLNSKTSSLKGYNEWRTNQIQEVEKAIGRPVKEGEMNKAFRILHKAQESGDVAGRGTIGSEQAREYIFDMMNDNSMLDDDEIMERLVTEHRDEVAIQETAKTTMES